MGWFGGSSSDDKSSSSSQSPTPDFNPPTAPLQSPSGSTPSTSFSSSGSQSSTQIRQKLESQISQEANLANARFLMTKVNESCFAHCVPYPGDKLSAKEDGCLSQCMEKYIESWNVVSRTYVRRLQTEGAQLPLGGGAGRGL